MRLLLVAGFVGEQPAYWFEPHQSILNHYPEFFILGLALFFGLLWNWVGFQFSNPTNSEGWLWALIDLSLPPLFYTSSVQLLKSED